MSILVPVSSYIIPKTTPTNQRDIAREFSATNVKGITQEPHTRRREAAMPAVTAGAVGISREAQEYGGKDEADEQAAFSQAVNANAPCPGSWDRGEGGTGARRFPRVVYPGPRAQRA